MDIPIGTWCAFVLCTTHNAQSKKRGATGKKFGAQLGISAPGDGAEDGIKIERVHKRGDVDRGVTGKFAARHTRVLRG
ncbi:hypothetical protein PTKU46_96790 [Paraburkholderia terrae]|uniref:hypothetical protein n=1 Tax=Paraburkholderia terrae TaxID=311230 RepID=UPI0030DE0E58